jgi:hypothetical protein
LATATTYFWRVKGINVLGSSPWSAIWRFSTISGPPLAPSLSYPSNGSGFHDNPTLWLDWTAAPGSEYFHLQLSTDASFISFVYNDSTVTNWSCRIGPLAYNVTYYWRVCAKNALGISSWSPVWHFMILPTKVADEEESPAVFSLGQNFPNPFNPVTTIAYQLPHDARVVLEIFSISGLRVRLLVNRMQPKGTYSIEWDGKSDNGLALASGTYIYRLSAGEYSQSRKMSYVR